MVVVNCLIFTTTEPISKLRGLIDCSTIGELCTKAVEKQTKDGNLLKKNIDIVVSELSVYEMDENLYTELQRLTTTTFTEQAGMTLLGNRLAPVEANMFYVLVGPCLSGTYNHSINQFHIPRLFVSAVNHSNRIIHCFY